MSNIRMDYPNILLISGAGRNTGKTTFACSLIRKISTEIDLYALKFSPHYHEPYETDHIIEKNRNYIISEEKSVTQKDSSLMLQAGAKKVYFIQSHENYLEKAFNVIRPLIKNKPIICESGGLFRFIKPGIFFFMINENDIPENKRFILHYNPYILNIFNTNTNIIDRITYQDNKFSLLD